MISHRGAGLPFHSGPGAVRIVNSGFHALALVSLMFAKSLWSTRAETVADRKGSILKDRETLEHDPRWKYNDVEGGFAEAKRTGKPLLVVMRCVPCKACSGIDARVLLDDQALGVLLDRFVCVRVINANALDLARFQFDFDLSFSTLIFNADGTLYGRYGSWVHQANPLEEATDGFRRALTSALELHRGYPANKTSLAGKQPGPSAYATPIDMPTLQGKYQRNLDWEGKVVQSCVHCHMIGDALREAHRQKNERIPSALIYPFPEPASVGMELALDHPARVRAVSAGSAAERAGVRVGDDVVSANGQPLISSADLSWVLHRAPDAARISIVLRRDEREIPSYLELAEGWRFRSDNSRRVGTWGMRAMALGGLQLEDVPDFERESRALSATQLGLRVKHAGEYGHHAAAKKAGFRKGDVLVEVGGLKGRLTEGELIGRLLRDHAPGDRIQVTVLREGQPVELSLPMQ